MYDKTVEIRGKNTGYFYFIDYDHPLATGNSGRVYLHRHLASLKEGRWLTSEEDVNHINGNRLDNSDLNLEVLSKSEHAKKDAIRLGRVILTEVICPVCMIKFKMVESYQKYCSPSCSAKSQRKFEISKEDLQILVFRMPITKVAEILGCSDVAVHKRCKRLGVAKPPRGYKFSGCSSKAERLASNQ